MPAALVILATGAEEMEAIITVDVLRRAGIEVVVAGLSGVDNVVCSRNVVIKPDVALADVEQRQFDVVICPGGLGGSNQMAESSKVGSILKAQAERDAYVAAICAAPIALRAHGVFSGKTLTSHPSMKDKIVDGGAYTYSEDRVVVDGKLITSRGPGTAFEFALKIVEILEGKDKMESLIPPMLLKL